MHYYSGEEGRMSRNKVLIIGLDGATWNLLKPLIKDGKLSTIKKLVDEGVHGDLESSIPHVTFPAWKCYSTGKNPGKLGVYWWMNVDVKNQKIIINDSKSFKSKELWDYLSSEDITCGIIGMPTTYPPKKVNGFMIAENIMPCSGNTYPKDLEKEIKDRFSYTFNFIDFHGADRNLVIEDRKRLIKQRFDVTNYLVKKYNPEFFHLTIFHIDNIQHFYWKYMEEKDKRYGKAIESSWILIDKELKKLIENFGDENTSIFLMSDHGFTSMKAVFNINKWLIEKGYLTLANTSLKSTVYNIGLKLGVNSKIINKLTNIPLIKYFLPDTEKIGTNLSETLIDWQKSKIIPLGEGVLYINTKIVDEKEYNSFKDKVIKEIKNIRNPNNGEKLAKAVYSKKDIYKGPYLDKAPDILILPNEGYEIISSFVKEKMKLWSFSPKEEGLSGIHKLHGIFTAKGPNIKRGIEIQKVKIYDIAPTILHIFGLPIPNDMDGRVLTEIFEEDSEFAKRKPKYVDPSYYEKEDEREKIKEEIGKLKKLGKI